MIWKRVLIGYGILLTAAAGGIAFACVFGVVATALQITGVDKESVSQPLPWHQIGWIFGVLVSLSGSFMKWQASHSKRAGIVADSSPDSEHPAAYSDTANSETTNLETAESGRRGGLVVSAAWGGFFGGLLGVALGVTFIMFWFSIVYSPFAPKSWVSATSVEEHYDATLRRQAPVITSRHPMVLQVFAVPVVVGLVGGAVFGAVVRVENVPPTSKHGPTSQNYLNLQKGT